MKSETIKPINRSQAESLYRYAYTVQGQSISGDWFDMFSTDDESEAISQAQYLRDTNGETVRVIYNLA